MWAGKVGGLPHRNSQRGGRRGGPKGRRSPQSSTRGIGCVDVPCTQLTNQWPHQHLTRVPFLAQSRSHTLQLKRDRSCRPWMEMGGHDCGHASLRGCTVMVPSNTDWTIKACTSTERKSWWDECNEWDTNEEMFPFLLIPQLHDGMISTAWTAKLQHLTRERHIYIYTHTWRLCCYHGRWGRHMVRVGGRCEGWIHPSAWRLRLGMGHEGVIHAYWGRRVVVLIDRASTGVLVTIHKHVQERLCKIMEKWQLHPCTPLKQWLKG